MGSIPTSIKYKNFIKAIRFLSVEKGVRLKVINKSGSKRSFRFFSSQEEIPDIFVVHEAKTIYTKDLKKFCDYFNLTKEEFIEFSNNL